MLKTLSIKKILKSYNFKLFCIALLWQIILTIAGYYIDLNKSSLLYHTSYWDGGWYSEITNYGYSKNPASPVFFPLFPLLVNIIKLVSFNQISYLWIGFIINVVSIWLAWVALSKIIKLYGYDKASNLIILLFMLAPGAFFMHMYYTEALFCALGFWAYYLALKEKWLLMGLAIGAITATRITGALFLILCAAVYVQKYNWKINKIFNKKILCFALAPVGFLTYGIYLLYLKDDFFYMLKALDANNDWAYHVFNPNFVSTIYINAVDSLKLLTGTTPMYYDGIVKIIIPTISIFALIGASFYSLFHKNKKMFLPLGLFGMASVIFLSINSNLISVHRYILPEVILYIVAIDILYSKSKLKALVYALAILSLLVQITLFVLFIRWWFVG